ncbi:peroxiredoxin [Sphingomonas jeddahensis]|uniref:Alkyl hydroperoxide reductase C n=1 Tax=Sphingomonas jeddahensis TaxID=1915074 RepID=A0A1V2EWU8_9SPHN|nr:peroxiredoxin [Sphingomonas jeddahensis]ONF97146.1 Alkyl hydroperoxide reductase subunit C [Sphingomonas jeddahensis]
MDPTSRPPTRLGDIAPDFTARTTKGPVRLSDYRGRWLVFFTHPADFTPVCTSEFVAFARLSDAFEGIDCALLGLSVDSLFSHFAWVRAIHDRFGVEIGFPIIEDPTLEVAKAYGMVAPDAVDASTVRTTMILDPEGVVRAMTVYPAEIGRSISEILRMVQALQRVHGGGVLAPADWTPGDKLLREPSQEVAEIVAAEEPSAWFYQPVPDAS